MFGYGHVEEIFGQLHGAAGAAQTGALRGRQPGTPEFIASNNAAVADVPKSQGGTPDFIIDKFQDSDALLSCAPRTQNDYRKILRAIANQFGDFPLAAVSDRKARGVFMEWRDGLSKRSRRQADYVWSVLARVFSWALDRRLIDDNPCEKGGRLYNTSRSECVWSDEDEVGSESDKTAGKFGATPRA